MFSRSISGPKLAVNGLGRLDEHAVPRDRARVAADQVDLRLGLVAINSACRSD